MSSKECFHFTYLNRAYSIGKNGLVSRVEDNSKAVKDSDPKISFSDGRYAAAGLIANFYRVYTDIKTGKRDPSRTDPDLARRVMESKSFEDFLGDGMYLMFDGTDIENTGGNRGHINPFDAATRDNIEPDKLKVCILKNEQTGELSYSKYDFAQYLMCNLTEDDYAKMPSSMIDDLKFYRENHADEMSRFENSKYSESFMKIDEFCQTFNKEIDEDIRKQEEKKSLSMKDFVKNALTKGVTTEQIREADRREEVLSNGKETIEKVEK